MPNWHELGAFLQQADDLDVDVHVIPVFYPPRLSLFRLPAAELEPIVDALHAEDATRRAALGRNRAAWDTSLRMVVEQLDRLRHGDAPTVPVDLPARPSKPNPRAATAEADLRAWSGRDWLEVRLEQDTILGVDVPEWAAPLAPASWVGLTSVAVRPKLEEALGPIASEEFLVDDDGLVVVEWAAGDPADPTRFRTVVVDDELRTATRLLIAPEAGRATAARTS